MCACAVEMAERLIHSIHLPSTKLPVAHSNREKTRHKKKKGLSSVPSFRKLPAVVMNAVYILWSLVAIILVIQPSGSQLHNPCVSPQYLEFGWPGTISCLFPDAIFTLLWYDAVDYLHSVPVLQYNNAMKTGFGYESGEYNIYPNGSLSINKVSMQHNRTFTVACIPTEEDVPTLFEITVIVTHDKLARCPSPQYGQVGDKAIIRCSVTVNFESITWYKEDLEDAIVAYGRKLNRDTSDAPEYDNDDYGLLIDGSLIIYEVGTEKSNVKYTVELIDNATSVGHPSQTVEFVAMDRIPTNTSTAVVPPTNNKPTTLCSSTDVSEPSTQRILSLGVVLEIMTIICILLVGVLVVAIIMMICILQRKVTSIFRQP